MASPKRSLSPEKDDEPEPKRARVESSRSSSTDALNVAEISAMLGDRNSEEQEEQQEAQVSSIPTLHFQSCLALQRSIATVLEHDGFDTATPEAMEGFTQLVETYLTTIIEETKWFAKSSRRELPSPVDFEKTLRRHNVPVSSLKPHLKPPVPKSKREPTYTEAITLDEDAFTTLPILGPELSGQPDKDAKPYIPASFPDFPSRHTYSFTKQEDVNIRDSKRIREQAARTAQQGEEALRRLVRASKMRKQKEVKSLVEKDGHGKERFRLWESTMRRFMGLDGMKEHSDQVEIADHSMIVNGDAGFSRKETSRLGKRTGAPLTNGNTA